MSRTPRPELASLPKAEVGDGDLSRIELAPEIQTAFASTANTVQNF